ncbi:MAG TPA: response regulator transcription factor [Rubrobacter sp.]|nr:response regulator transcription factor [Rubrobacter sp.]
MKPGTRILLVEDDHAITSFVGPQLKHRNLSVRCAYDGEEALAQIEQFRPELVVLDIMLPKFDGVGVLNRIRHSGNRVPVIMLTARDATLDKVHSLELGADDYLTKPFDIKELVARMQALLRRVDGDEILRVGDLEVDTATREVRRGEREIELTYREYELLEFMAKNPRRALSRNVLLARVWDQEFGIATNVVDVYIGYLRKKVDVEGEPKLIRTVRGFGYALKEK